MKSNLHLRPIAALLFATISSVIITTILVLVRLLDRILGGSLSEWLETSFDAIWLWDAFETTVDISILLTIVFFALGLFFSRKQMKDIEGRFDTIDEKLESMDQKLDKLDNIDETLHRIESLLRNKG